MGQCVMTGCRESHSLGGWSNHVLERNTLNENTSGYLKQIYYMIWLLCHLIQGINCMYDDHRVLNSYFSRENMGGEARCLQRLPSISEVVSHVTRKYFLVGRFWDTCGDVTGRFIFRRKTRQRNGYNNSIQYHFNNVCMLTLCFIPICHIAFTIERSF